MVKYFIITIALFSVASCTNNKKNDKASMIIDKCIEAHGGENYRHLDVSFDYRKFSMHLMQNEGTFLYERTTKDSAGNEIHDALNNDVFTRKINGKVQDLSKKDYEKYKEGLNAIAYFALLPYKLSEPAVNLKYLGEIKIGDITYDKIDVTFDKEAGGKDHQDKFCYWINRQTHTMDYLSYSNGGPRFRRAIRRQKVDGVLFQDYENYKIQDSTISTADYDKEFNSGKAILLSKIEQSNYSSNGSK